MIAPREKVLEVLKKTVSVRLKVESQDELRSLVLRELKKADRNYTLTTLRLRKLALTLPELEVKAKTRKLTGFNKIENCPICESPVKPYSVKNLMGKDIVVGYECTRCGYQSDLEAFVPMKYEFVWKANLQK